MCHSPSQSQTFLSKHSHFYLWCKRDSMLDSGVCFSFNLQLSLEKHYHILIIYGGNIFHLILKNMDVRQLIIKQIMVVFGQTDQNFQT